MQPLFHPYPAEKVIVRAPTPSVKNLKLLSVSTPDLGNTPTPPTYEELSENGMYHYYHFKGSRILHTKMQLSSIHITTLFQNCNDFLNSFLHERRLSYCLF